MQEEMELAGLAQVDGTRECKMETMREGVVRGGGAAAPPGTWDAGMELAYTETPKEPRVSCRSVAWTQATEGGLLGQEEFGSSCKPRCLVTLIHSRICIT